MHDEVRSEADARLRRRRLVLRRARCLRVAGASGSAGAVGVLLLCVGGLKPAAVAVPVMLVTLSLLCAAASAALFARVARLHLDTPDPGEDEDGGGPGGGGSDSRPEPPEGGDLGIDWEQFEHEFRSYCDRVTVAR